MKLKTQKSKFRNVITPLLVAIVISMPGFALGQDQNQDLIFGNNVKVMFKKQDGTTDGTNIRRQPNGAMRYNSEQDVYFTQLNNSAFIIRGLDNANAWKNFIRLTPNGDSYFLDNVGIGTTAPDYELSVNGTIEAEEILVQSVNGMDIVFEEDYPLRTLKETASFIEENRHLPEIASAKTMAEEGVELKKFSMQLLQKIEELTLYQIQLSQEIEVLKKQIEDK